MSPFEVSIDELYAGFSHLQIPTSDPGFCDHPVFLQLERQNPELLNLYAAYVARQHYSKAYLSRAEVTIRAAASVLHRELVAHGRLGACVDISGIHSRILDKEGIWNTCVKGSLTINFPATSGIQPRYFWSCDRGEFVAGHAWLFAPPFTVVDISARQQPYGASESRYIPEIVLSQDTKMVTVDVQDIVSPTVRQEMLQHGIPPSRHLEFGARYIPGIFSAIPPILVHGQDGATLKYSPVAIHAPDLPFEEMRNMEFAGLTPWELYSTKLKPEILGYS